MTPIFDQNFKNRWERFSLIGQLANIGSEVNRALMWKNKSPELFESAAIRTLELLNLTISDPRWRKKSIQPRSTLKELCRLREIFCDTCWGAKEYKTSLADLERYFFHFAIASRIKI